MESEGLAPGARVTRSLRKRLSSMDSDASSSRPNTPTQSTAKLATVAEGGDSPPIVVRMTRRNSTLDSPVRTPYKNSKTAAIARSETPDPSTPAKRGRGRLARGQAPPSVPDIIEVTVKEEKSPIQTLEKTLTTNAENIISPNVPNTASINHEPTKQLASTITVPDLQKEITENEVTPDKIINVTVSVSETKRRGRPRTISSVTNLKEKIEVHKFALKTPINKGANGSLEKTELPTKFPDGDERRMSATRTSSTSPNNMVENTSNTTYGTTKDTEELAVTIETEETNDFMPKVKIQRMSFTSSKLNNGTDTLPRTTATTTSKAEELSPLKPLAELNMQEDDNSEIVIIEDDSFTDVFSIDTQNDTNKKQQRRNNQNTVDEANVPDVVEPVFVKGKKSSKIHENYENDVDYILTSNKSVYENNNNVVIAQNNEKDVPFKENMLGKSSKDRYSAKGNSATRVSDKPIELVDLIQSSMSGNNGVEDPKSEMEKEISTTESETLETLESNTTKPIIIENIRLEPRSAKAIEISSDQKTIQETVSTATPVKETSNEADKSKSVAFNEFEPEYASKKVYPKTPVHAKSKSYVDPDVSQGLDKSEHGDQSFVKNKVDGNVLERKVDNSPKADDALKDAHADAAKTPYQMKISRKSVSSSTPIIKNNNRTSEIECLDKNNANVSQKIKAGIEVTKQKLKSWTQSVHGKMKPGDKIDTIAGVENVAKNVHKLEKILPKLKEGERESMSEIRFSDSDSECAIEKSHISIEEDEDEEESANEKSKLVRSSFILSEAIDVDDNYQSGDSMDTEERREIEENEIPIDSHSIGSNDTEDELNSRDEQLDEEEGGSFIVSDAEEELLDYSNESENTSESFSKYKKNKKFKRVQIASTDDESTSDIQPKTKENSDFIANEETFENSSGEGGSHSLNKINNSIETKKVSNASYKENNPETINDTSIKNRSKTSLSSNLSESATKLVFSLESSESQEEEHDHEQGVKKINTSRNELLHKLRQSDRFNKTLHDVENNVPDDNLTENTNNIINDSKTADSACSSTTEPMAIFNVENRQQLPADSTSKQLQKQNAIDVESSSALEGDVQKSTMNMKNAFTETDPYFGSDLEFNHSKIQNSPEAKSVNNSSEVESKLNYKAAIVSESEEEHPHLLLTSESIKMLRAEFYKTFTDEDETDDDARTAIENRLRWQKAAKYPSMNCGSAVNEKDEWFNSGDQNHISIGEPLKRKRSNSLPSNCSMDENVEKEKRFKENNSDNDGQNIIINSTPNIGNDKKVSDGMKFLQANYESYNTDDDNVDEPTPNSKSNADELQPRKELKNSTAEKKLNKSRDLIAKANITITDYQICAAMEPEGTKNSNESGTNISSTEVNVNKQLNNIAMENDKSFLGTSTDDGIYDLPCASTSKYNSFDGLNVALEQCTSSKKQTKHGEMLHKSYTIGVSVKSASSDNKPIEEAEIIGGNKRKRQRKTLQNPNENNHLNPSESFIETLSAHQQNKREQKSGTSNQSDAQVIEDHQHDQALLTSAAAIENALSDLNHMQGLFNPLQKTRCQPLYDPKEPTIINDNDEDLVPKPQRRNLRIPTDGSFVETVAEHQRELLRQERKRKRLSKSFCGASSHDLTQDFDIIRHLHKKSKISNEQTEEISPIAAKSPMMKQTMPEIAADSDNISSNELQNQNHYDQLYEAANLAQLEKKLHAKKKNMRELKSKQRIKKPIASGSDKTVASSKVGTVKKSIKRLEKKAKAVKQACEHAKKIIAGKSNIKKENDQKAAPVQEKAQLPPCTADQDSLLKGFLSEISAVRGQTNSKKKSKEILSPPSVRKYKNTKIVESRLGNFIEAPLTPKKKKYIEKIYLSTGVVCVEPLTPSSNHNFREQSVTPKGYKSCQLSAAGQNGHQRKRYNHHGNSTTGMFLEETLPQPLKQVGKNKGHVTKLPNPESVKYINHDFGNASINFKQNDIARRENLRGPIDKVMQRKELRVLRHL